MPSRLDVVFSEPLLGRTSQEGEYRGVGTKVIIQPTAEFIHHIMTIRDPAKLTKLGRDIQPGKPEAAVAYFQRAVDLGYADAYGELAFCHLYRRGIPSLDPEVAYKLAEQGFRFSSPIATSALAYCYQKGTGQGRVDVHYSSAQSFVLVMLRAYSHHG